MRKRPNVIVIMTDQHRYDLMSCAGRDLVPTPNIDRLAARGVRFTDAYCASPICVASRMAMLSGLHPRTTGVVSNSDRLDWRYRTIAHHFAEHGYLTALIGKMHFNDAHAHGFTYYLSINDWLTSLGPKQHLYANEIASHPLSPQFFDTMFDTGAGFPDLEGLWSGPSPWAGAVEGSQFGSMASLLPEPDQLDAFIARESVKFMSAQGDQPFLLFASLMKPHTPLFAPEPWASRYPIDAVELPEIGPIGSYPQRVQERIREFNRAPQRLRRAHRAGYLANLAYVDVCIGRIIDGLERIGALEDALVVYTSDHGEMDGDHGLYQKFCLFEQAVRVPLIVCAEGAGMRGTANFALVEQVGLYPTLSDLAGLPPPDTTSIVAWPQAPARLDGASFAGMLGGSATPPEAAFCEFNAHSPFEESMVRTRRFKYVHNGGSTHAFYDLQADPAERINRIDDPALGAEIADHRARLLAWQATSAGNRSPARPSAGPS